MIQKATSPNIEEERLSALKSYNVLDTLPEKEYDAITRLASYICEAPIALITLIDADRQWFKSKVGIDGEYTLRVDAFCNHTIQSDEILEVSNALEDDRFKDNVFVTGVPDVRFYAGAPLIDNKGYRLGSLCVIDSKPRKLTEQQRDALSTLANEVVSHLNLRRQKNELEDSLKIHQEFYTLFNTSPEIHCIMDKDFKIELINGSVTGTLGYTPEEAKGRPIWDFFLAEAREITLAKLKEAIAKQQRAFEIETPLYDKNEEIKWLSWTLTFKNNKWYASGRDISQQKKLNTELEILSFASRKSPGGILIRNAEGLVVWMNDSMESITGYTSAEMEGKTFGTTLLGEDSDLSVFNKALQAVSESRAYEVEIKIYKKDRTPIWVWISNSPLFNQAGQVERQVGIIVDITERKKAEQQLKMLSLVASSTTGGVIINDSNGNVEWINSGFEKITGYSLKDIKGKHLGDVVKGELTDSSIIERTRELSKNKQSFEVDLLIYRKDGQPLWISVINSVILDEDGKVDKYIEVIIDITAKKKVELELIAAKEEAIQLNRAKDMFISVLSHEMRTPLNAVIGMSHLLLDDNPAESQRENLNILKFSAENLLTLINDVLDFTKIETGNIDLEKAQMDMHELVQSVSNSMKYRALDKNISLSTHIDSSIPSGVLGDRTRLCQILLNLASNAIKFTEKGSVTLDLKVIEQSEKKIRIRFAVSDTGIGIANDKINTIFESFKQAEADTTRKYGGTGLGLAISKRLIELHDSRINVDSVLGQGSTFWFTITFEKAEGSTPNSNTVVEAGLNINVLVVDDNQINRLLVNKVLKKWGATTDFAENGREALEKVEENQNYDAILMDIHMPEMGGLEATQLIRAKTDAYFQKVPIIALTASMLNTEITQINEAGMDDYLLKPFDPKTLYSKLSRYQKQ